VTIRTKLLNRALTVVDRRFFHRDAEETDISSPAEASAGSIAHSNWLSGIRGVIKACGHDAFMADPSARDHVVTIRMAGDAAIPTAVHIAPPTGLSW
jgi:hypothetical protein